MIWFTKQNCCNCIAISLYYKGVDVNLNKLVKYLSSIQRTIKNVAKNLQDWVVRIYLDKSVCDTIESFKPHIKSYLTEEEQQPEVQQQLRDQQKCVELYTFMINAENTEIYTYVCPKIVSGELSIGRTRTFRFVPLKDKTVNVCAIREADGIVTNLDCHNLKIFAKSNKLFYLPTIIESYEHVRQPDHMQRHLSYRMWLTFYKSVIAHEYFSKKNNLFDLLAGSIAFRLKVKPDIFDKYMALVQEKIQYVIKNRSQIDFKKLDISERADYSMQYIDDMYHPDFINMLNMAFDEIFLLDLFKDLISVPYIPRNDLVVYDQQALNFVLNFIYADQNIKKVTYENLKNEIAKVWSKLINDGYIKKINLRRIWRFYNTICVDSACSDLDLLYSIDALLIETNIITDQIFDVASNQKLPKIPGSVLSLINEPYDPTYEHEYIYDKLNREVEQIGGKLNTYDKYMKYKNKYLALKNTKLTSLN